MRVLCSIALLALFFVVGCAPPIKSGKVVSKRFVAAHYEDSQVLICADPPMYMPQTDHIPDRWHVTFGNTAENGRYYTRTVPVSQATYSSTKEGDWFSIQE